MKDSKWLVRYFWTFYSLLMIFCIYGMINNGIKNIQVNLFFFALLGLFGLPLVISFIPSIIETINIFGIELQFKKQLREYDEISEEKIKNLILTLVKEDSLTNEGKEQLKEIQEVNDER